MKCPYCNGEMEQGMIESQEPINWLKEHHFINQPNKKEGELTLAKASPVRRAVVEAWKCGNCRKIIIEY